VELHRASVAYPMGRTRKPIKPETWSVEVPQAWSEATQQTRLRKGLSVPDLAKAAGVPQEYIEHLENNQKLPDYKGILWLASALDVSIDEYIGQTKGDDLG